MRLQADLDELKARNFRVVHIVAKAPVATVAEFDAMANQSLGKKQVADSANALARRSVVWPVADAPAAAQPTPPPPARTAPRVEEDDWKAKVFGRR